jgi:hypothetical protein
LCCGPFANYLGRSGWTSFPHTAHLLALMEVSFPVMDDMLLSTQSITFLLVFACLVLLSAPLPLPTMPPSRYPMSFFGSVYCLSPRVHWPIVAHRCLSFLVPCLADTTLTTPLFSPFVSLCLCPVRLDSCLFCRRHVFLVYKCVGRVVSVAQAYTTVFLY